MRSAARSRRSPRRAARLLPGRGREVSRGMSDGEPLEAVRRLLHLADAYGLAELVVEEGGFKIAIRAGQPAAPAAAPPPTAAGTPVLITAPPSDAARFHALLSPMTGVFYRSPSPDTPPFVEPGDRIEEGQAIGLI